MAIDASGNGVWVLSSHEVFRVIVFFQNGKAGIRTMPPNIIHRVHEPGQIQMLQHADGRAFVAISSRHEVSILQTAGQIITTISFKNPTPSSFCKMHFDPMRALLLISNSDRGSIFAFELSPEGKPTAMVEWSTPKNLVDFVDALAEDPPSLFCISTDGIAQLDLSQALDAFSSLASTSSINHSAPLNHLALENDTARQNGVEESERPLSTDVRNKIKVDVEMAVATDHESAAPSPRLLPKHKPLASHKRDMRQSPASDLDGLEEILLKNLGSMLETTFGAQAEKAAASRAADQAAEIQRQEELLELVSSTLTKQTSKALDSSIRSESKILL